MQSDNRHGTPSERMERMKESRVLTSSRHDAAAYEKGGAETTGFLREGIGG
jgi:hypothetical protein